MHPKDISIHDYTYDLPHGKIAIHPVHPRDSARLLIYDHREIRQDFFRNIKDYLPENATLVFNDTRVIKSRILFPKPTGSVVEIFCLEPATAPYDYELALNQTGSCLWKCMIGKAGKWKEKQLIKTSQIGSIEVTLTATLTEKLPEAFVVQFSWTPAHFTFGEIINIMGVTPLPPYIKRAANEQDAMDYQTVYAGHDGSVAAPTAGLHFTKELMEKLHDHDIHMLFTTLHVGAGTFKPVKSNTMEGHLMHPESMAITTDFLESLLLETGRKIIPVGTTAARTLESIYWMGNKILNDDSVTPEQLKITQWEVYEEQPAGSRKDAIRSLLNWLVSHSRSRLMIETSIIITPGYVFRMCDGLITNFHQPESTLLLLVAALAGNEWKKIYEFALENDFRFLSYGDACLILP